jgi:hypothetical protein
VSVTSSHHKPRGARSLSRLSFRSNRLVMVAIAGLMSLLLVPTGAMAQSTDTTVTGLTVRQDDGAALLSWNPVAGAENYEIERTEVDESGEPVGSASIVGVWRTDRNQWSITENLQPTFADAGFLPGSRQQWRVRAVVDGSEFSEPVVETTRPPFGPEEFLTGWELSNRTATQAAWTTYENEIALADSIAEASNRMRVETIGHTVQDRRIDMYILGHPRPKATAEEIANSPTVMLNCNVHGNEPSGREACLMVTRELAFSNDPWVIDILTNANVLIVPAINGDGRAANTRGNSTGQDLNRDHSLLRQPETFAFAEALRDYAPDAVVDGHEFGNVNTGDLPLLWARHRGVAPTVHDEGMALVREHFFTEAGPRDGWWAVPYPFAAPPGSTGTAGAGQETILRNTLGLKNMLGMLLESRTQTGPTRPVAGGNTGPENAQRRVYSHLWTYREFLTAHRERRESSFDAIMGGYEFNIANEGPLYVNGEYDAPGGIPLSPRPVVDVGPVPDGYWLTHEQYTGEQADGPTVQERLAAHGIRTEVHDDGVLVRLAQPLRGLIPLLLDEAATEAPLPEIGERAFDTPPPLCTGTVNLAGADSGVADRAVDDQLCLDHVFLDTLPWRNHGAFVRHVNEVSSQLRAEGVLTPRERAQLISAAGRS